jgi:acetyl-CoA acetyltransferase
MAMRDTAIVAYAETKIVPKADKDIWALGAEVLEELLNKTGLDKREIDGLILSSSMTGSGNCFWSQATADQLSLELDFCQTVDIGGCSPTGALARAAIAIDAGLCETVFCLFADTQARENNSKHPATIRANGPRPSACSDRRRRSVSSPTATNISSASIMRCSASLLWRSAMARC